MEKTIVLIQDNVEILNLMDDVLKEEGYEVISSLSTEPIENLDVIEPDVVILDDNIKGSKSGSEVISGLKSNPETKDISAVLSSTSLNLPETAKNCNADDYLEKPFDVDHLIAVVEKNS